MSKRLPKVMVDGRELNQCPVCGQPTNVSAWTKWKMCLHCHKLTQQGIELTKVKRMRANELAGCALINEVDQAMESVRDVPTSDSTNESSYSPKYLYNFRTTYPPGVYIATRDRTEARYLQEVYNYYSRYGENIPEFNVLISGILQAKLDLYRNSTKVSDPEILFNELKGLKDIDIKLGDQINKTTRVLDDLKDRANSQSGNIITTKFASMLQYMHDHEQEYMGIGICSGCNSRVIFKTNFPTFKTWMLERLDRIEHQLSASDVLDQKTIKVVAKAIRTELTDRSLAETYIVEHIRELEASLIEQTMRDTNSRE